MIKKDGPVDVTIVAACIGAPKYPLNPAKDPAANNRGEAIAVWGDVILTCQDDDGNCDDWHGELSNRNGVSNYAHLTRTDMTIETLQKIGFGVADWNALYEQIDEDGNIPNIINTRATANVASREYEGKTYYDIKYLNPLGSTGIKKISKADLFNSFQTGGFRKEEDQQAQPAPAPQQTNAAPAPVNNAQAAATTVAPGGVIPKPAGIPAPGGTSGAAPANPYAAG